MEMLLSRRWHYLTSPRMHFSHFRILFNALLLTIIWENEWVSESLIEYPWHLIVRKKDKKLQIVMRFVFVSAKQHFRIPRSSQETVGEVMYQSSLTKLKEAVKLYVKLVSGWLSYKMDFLISYKMAKQTYNLCCSVMWATAKLRRGNEVFGVISEAITCE